MRILSDNISNDPSRVVFPILESFPKTPIMGEVIYLNTAPYQGVMLYTGTEWVELYSTTNNIWEVQIAEREQRVFTLTNEYPTNGHSIVVYKNGIRLSQYSVIEISPHNVGYREFDEEGEEIILEGGEKFEFQIFNVRNTKPFDVKSFNRRVQ